ncbi:hypothetical protein CABS01_06906 [Colletotrichum abscissum]|uniref:Heterokaryon incompatibility domain-containing protein n=1 Tax=Colletotrichum abscissum TaxID=1671311 RepID=A0A9Q0B1X6_9PEZI|nr:uncharacterized protein CABS01_06906 [Colletotrichum abscissum]KAI3541558.1 hypothetical protein CABS02_10732 [Colletotrichum abscissum]KAK1514927.1 hypothetical protein CABS01_06906 [Colletotrichum abscissum]
MHQCCPTDAAPSTLTIQSRNRVHIWLVNTDNLVLEEVSEPSSIKYAILSHTWADDEVTFQDFHNIERSGARHKSGFSKIQKTCELARQRGLHYAWVDTCCIDKSSSAELSEAINSMFSWYKEPAVCFVLLSDLPAFERLVEKTPTAVEMSWAASRKTKRVEDHAYSLLGIFDINMPMIYGEGSKAFRRLQEEISRETNDLSLFAWKGHPQGSVGSQMSRGIFARSPSEFSSCSTMQRFGTRQDSHSEFTLTNKVRVNSPSPYFTVLIDDLDWGSSQEEAFEKALLSICTNPRFQATEVEFVTKKITDGQRGFRMVKDYRATFRVELEMHQDHDGIITYHASLSGKI